MRLSAFCLCLLHSKILSEIYSSDFFVLRKLFRCSGPEYLAIIDYIRSVSNRQSLAHVVIGYQHADPARSKFLQNLLYVHHGDWIDAGERFVEQDEPGLDHKTARDLCPPSLASRKLIRLGVPDISDVEFA